MSSFKARLQIDFEEESRGVFFNISACTIGEKPGCLTTFAERWKPSIVSCVPLCLREECDEGIS